MDAMYMQKGKIVYKCEIVTITYTSHCEYETYNACVSILHIYAYMTFALRTHYIGKINQIRYAKHCFPWLQQGAASAPPERVFLATWRWLA